MDYFVRFGPYMMELCPDPSFT
uniref:Uncharacterized protein n=1 Tax=Anguilla anguilla TaxID=7936 RepID=A0A0E9Q742_ANGAN